jgi:hypothetical protein
VHAAATLGGRHALDAVPAGFVSEVGYVNAFKRKADAVEPAGCRDDQRAFALSGLAFGQSFIGGHKIGHEELRVVAALGGTYFKAHGIGHDVFL